MLLGGRSRRYEERFPTSLTARVRGWDDDGSEWEEEARLRDISRSGARFRIGRDAQSGQLLYLAFAMPVFLRVFDLKDAEYRIWAVVRRVQQLATAEAEGLPFEVSVAFAGKQAPQSFLNDRTARFDLLPAPNKQGLWPLHQRPRKQIL